MFTLYSLIYTVKTPKTIMGPIMQVNLEKIKKLPPDVRKDFFKMYLKYTEKKKESLIRKDFLSFVKYIWPDFIQGSHHKVVAQKFNDIADGKIKRLSSAINEPCNNVWLIPQYPMQ